MRVGVDPILPSLHSSASFLSLTYLSHLLVYFIKHCHFLTTQRPSNTNTKTKPSDQDQDYHGKGSVVLVTSSVTREKNFKLLLPFIARDKQQLRGNNCQPCILGACHDLCEEIRDHLFGDAVPHDDFTN
jgi:hypothetical protein